MAKKIVKKAAPKKTTPRKVEIPEDDNRPDIEQIIAEADGLTGQAELVLREKEQANIRPVDGDSMHIDVRRAIERAGELIEDREVRPNQGKFAALYQATHEQLQEAFEQQAAIAEATVKVVSQHTRLMKAGLEAALGDLRRQTERFTADD